MCFFVVYGNLTDEAGGVAQYNYDGRNCRGRDIKHRVVQY